MEKPKCSIKLNKDQVLIVDADVYEWIKKYHWYAIKDHNIFYVFTNLNTNGKRNKLSLHRILTDCPVGMVVDHIDGDGCNNSSDNLRVCTRSENAWNRRKSIDNVSGYKGTFWNKKCQKWRAAIGINGKKIHLGTFTTAEDAYKAYCEAAEKYHGEFKNVD